MNNNPYSSGDKVLVDGSTKVFTVHSIYSDTEVSLGLADYPDVEQDYITDISILSLVQ